MNTHLLSDSYTSQGVSLYVIGTLSGLCLVLYGNSMKLIVQRPTTSLLAFNMIQSLLILMQLIATGVLLLGTPAGCLYNSGYLTLLIHMRSLAALAVQCQTIHKIRPSSIIAGVLSVIAFAQICASAVALISNDGSDCTYFASWYSRTWTLVHLGIQSLLIICIMTLVQIGQHYKTIPGQTKRSLKRRALSFFMAVDESSGTQTIYVALLALAMVLSSQRTSVNSAPLRMVFCTVCYLESWCIYWIAKRTPQQDADGESMGSRGLPIEQLRVNTGKLDANDILTPRRSLVSPPENLENM
ncbi:hypothetical protein BASA50_007744 [Batrachochytrium salamandrivorans]|uniref:Cytochrome b561 domain-containing protein n=1 Tax=Batrachochytrium salamandrivorans TaxID=1357716 RepID=A0ABQ8F621_9FUNG|nr:hypothetical protein BASA60_011358 [Batrachochytrium salamandrivorans]KAH6588933.1 hypothetical protein BASA61_005774 [Batrachochytrium salamandrivorans]KAH6592906.1 hypothetical protein BASA50_007744 [Batrachochytrium salamandrivorans]KAH9247703.1 hypothetical protein BASA81_014693 [Batrachochytrium salamandrivorans]KAH9270187.1 hypothetical protein BASA83_007706 [Batrachochytrium salamandrivorans]